MDTSLIFFIFVAIAAATILFMTAKVVPQREEWIVQRLGKYNRTLDAGLKFLFPLLTRWPTNTP